MLYNYQDYIKESKDPKDDKAKGTKYSDITDFTFLKENTTMDKLKEMCKTAQENGYYAVCVMPEYISDVYGLLENDDIKIVTVVNYPEGKNKSEQNLEEVSTAISEGVDEIDFVIDYAQIKEASVLEEILNSKVNSKELDKKGEAEEKENIKEKYDKIEGRISEVSSICHRNGIVLKVILETGELTIEQIKKACEICDRAGVDFVMTSTGTKEKGAELEKVKYMRKVLPEYIKIKVSGGIRTVQNADEFFEYADRFGTSSVLKDIQENKK